MDLTTLTAAVDFDAVGTALLAVGSAIAVIYVGWKGVKLVLRGIRGA
jgi:hypothetical protein